MKHTSRNAEARRQWATVLAGAALLTFASCDSWFAKPADLVFDLTEQLPRSAYSIASSRGRGETLLIAQRGAGVAEVGMWARMDCEDGDPRLIETARFEFPVGHHGWRHLGSYAAASGEAAEVFFSRAGRSDNIEGTFVDWRLGEKTVTSLSVVPTEGVLDAALGCPRGVRRNQLALLRTPDARGSEVVLQWIDLSAGTASETIALSLPTRRPGFLERSHMACLDGDATCTSQDILLVADEGAFKAVAALDASSGRTLAQTAAEGHSAFTLSAMPGVDGEVLVVADADALSFFGLPGLERIETRPLISARASSAGDFDGDGFEDLALCSHEPRSTAVWVIALADERVLHRSDYGGSASLLVFGNLAVLPDPCATGSDTAVAVSHDGQMHLYRGR